MIRKIHKNNRNKTDTCLEGWGVGDTHFTGSHIGGIHISLGICVRGYTYHGDAHFTVTPAGRRDVMASYPLSGSKVYSGNNPEAESKYNSLIFAGTTCHCFLRPIRIDLALLIAAQNSSFNS